MLPRAMLLLWLHLIKVHRVKLYPTYWIYAALVPLVTVILDQLSKYAILDMFDVPHNICEINPFPGLFKEFSPVIDWALVCNQGVSFGMLSGDSSFKRWALTIFAAVMCGVLLYFLARTQKKTMDDNGNKFVEPRGLSKPRLLTRLSIGLIIGGAIGNGIDRALYGAVTDFISVHQLLPFFPWVFNIADSAISCGVVGLLIASFWSENIEKKAAQSADAPKD